MSIKKLLINNSFWVFCKNISSQILKIACKLILVRILMPEDFGLVAMAITIVDIVSILGSCGTGVYLVQSRDKNEDKLIVNVLAVNIVLHAIIFFLLWFLAPIIAFKVKKVLLLDVLRVSCIYSLFSPFYKVCLAVLEKRMKFKQIFAGEIICILSYCIIAISCAYFKLSYWSLIHAHYISGLINTGLLLLFTKPCLNFKFIDKKILREMFHFSKYVFGHQLVATIKNHYDNLIIGIMLPLQALGFYAWAFNIASLPMNLFIHIINLAIFPIYCEYKDDRIILLNLLDNILKIVAITIIPTMFGLCIFADNCVLFLLGFKWLPLVPVLRILCVYTIFRCVLTCFGPLFYALGKSKDIFITGTISFILSVILLPVLISYFGIVGCASTITVCMFLEGFIIRYFFLKLFSNMKVVFIKNISKIIFANTIFIICAIILKKMHVSSWLIIIISIVLYGLLIYNFEKELVKKITAILKQKSRKIKVF